MSATPRPWRVQREDVVTPGRPRLTEWHIYRASGLFGHPAVCELEEDAELIVRACNAHEELLAAVKEDLASLELELEAEEADEGRAGQDSETTDLIAERRALIAKAEGR